MPWIEPLTRRAAWITIAAIVVVFLTVAWQFVLPLALSILLAFLLSPLVRYLTRHLKSRMVAVLITCTVAFTVLLLAGLVVVYQMADFANELPNYRHTIVQKIVTLRDASGGPIARFMDAVTDIKQDVEATSTQPSEEEEALPGPAIKVVNVQQDEATVVASAAATAAIIAPFIEPVVMAAAICILVVYLLIYAEDIRDRVMVLAGAQQISITTQALEEAGKRIGHYLLMQALINSLFGGAIALGLTVIGLPNALLLGLLAGALRFIPLIGPWIGALLPLVLSVAIFDSWLPVVEVGILFLICEGIANMILEPWLYGSGTGLSGMAVIVAIMFWTWVWGSVGLLLAVPLTVCLVVLGKFIEPLRVFYIVLGDEPVLAGERRLYHRLMTGDFVSAEEIVHDATEKLGEARVADEYLMPVLQTARTDHERGALSDERYKFINDSITGLGAEVTEPRTGGTVACVGVEDLDGPAAELLCITLTKSTSEKVFSMDNILTADIVARVKEDGIDTLILVCTSRESLGRARLLNKALRTRLSGVQVFIGDFSGNTSGPLPQVVAGDAVVLPSVASVVDRIQQMQRSQLNVTAAPTGAAPTAPDASGSAAPENDAPGLTPRPA